MAYEVDPTKRIGSEKRAPRLQQTLDGWRKGDPPTQKKLPVEVDVPEFLAALGLADDSTEQVKAVGDQALIAYYYLLRVGEYTVKGSRNESKQTVQFKMEDVTFFKKNSLGQL